MGSLPPIARAQVSYERTRDVYAALRAAPDETLEAGGGRIDLVYADSGEGLDRILIREWVRSNAEAVIHYFGRFPVEHVGLLIIADAGRRLHGGTAYGFETSAIRIRVGRDTAAEAFARDWRMAHEMIHLALPIVPTKSWWLLEGSATYVEPIARAQVGALTPEEAWDGLWRGMPQGQPQPGDLGLDHTPTWGRTYWGGAIFCFEADLRIRMWTHGKRGLQDAFRAINRESGGNTARWSMERLIEVGDAATGTTILSDLYAAMAGSAVTTDLDARFADLGVRRAAGQVTLDDQALSANLRQAILPEA